MLEVKDLTVREVMSRLPEVLAPDQTVAQAYELLTEQGITGAPVIDDDGRLRGVFSLRDVLAGLAAVLTADEPADLVARLRRERVVDHLGRGALTCELSTPLVEACKLMVKERVHRVVVVDEDRPVGVLSAIDVVRGLACLGALEGDEVCER